MPIIERLFERFLIYLPHVFVAAMILLFGYILSNFFGRAALIASVNADIKVSGLIGKFVKFTVFMLAATMALEQLGLRMLLLSSSIQILLASVGLAFGLAFGLGGKAIAEELLRGLIHKKKE